MRKIFFSILILSTSVICHSQSWHPVAYNDFDVGTESFGIYNNTLVIGGAHDSERIVTWSETELDTIVFGRNAIPNCFSNYNGNLIMGGGFGITLYLDTFPYMYAIPYTDKLAQWDGDSTFAIFTNSNNSITVINALAVYHDELYIGGAMNKVQGVNVHHIAKWNGTQWSNPGGGIGLGNTRIRSMVVYNDELYVGGEFYTAGGVLTYNIARWDGTEWDSVGAPGLGNTVNAMVVDTANNYLYAAGAFIVPGAIKSKNIARWDGIKWDSLSIGCPYDVLALELFDGRLFASVVQGSGEPTDTVLLAWDGEEWEYMIGFDRNIRALKSYKGNLYVGGGFETLPSGDSVNYIACYGNNCPEPLSINEQTNKIGFKIYPNPNTGQITIEWEPLTAADFITITTIEGKETERIKITRQENKVSLSTASWAKGIYFCTLYEGTKKLAGQKIVVE